MGARPDAVVIRLDTVRPGSSCRCTCDVAHVGLSPVAARSRRPGAARPGLRWSSEPGSGTISSVRAGERTDLVPTPAPAGAPPQPPDRRIAAGEGSDGVLAAQAGLGDRQAFAELVRRHTPAMSRYAYRMLGDLGESEDIVQEALLSAWRGLAAFRGRIHRADLAVPVGGHQGVELPTPGAAGVGGPGRPAGPGRQRARSLPAGDRFPDACRPSDRSRAPTCPAAGMLAVAGGGGSEISGDRRGAGNHRPGCPGSAGTRPDGVGREDGAMAVSPRTAVPS